MRQRKKQALKAFKNNNLIGTKKKTSIDHELTELQINLGYAFEYGVNFKERTISITEDIDEAWYHIVDQALTHFESLNKSTVTIRINSPGGCTYSAIGIIARMRKSKCHIVTEGLGHVMSAATLILASGKSRKFDRLGEFMWHEASYDPGHERVSNHEAYLEQIKKEEDKWAGAMAELTTKDKEFWLENGVGKDAFMSAEELLEYGVVDELF